MVVHTKTLHDASMLVQQVRQHLASRRVRGYTALYMQRYNALVNFLEFLYNLLLCSYIPVQCRGQRDPHRGQFPSAWYGSSWYGSSWYGSSSSGFPCLAYVRDRRGAPWLLNWTLLNARPYMRGCRDTYTSAADWFYIFRPTYLIGQIARRRCDSQHSARMGTGSGSEASAIYIHVYL